MALLSLSAFLALAPVTARPAPRTLQVVASDNYPPYLFIGPDGQAEGFLVDRWKLWSRKTGIPVDLEPMRWDRAQRMMHDGKADVLDMVFRNPVRDQLYTFSRPYARESVDIFVDRSIHGIHDARSLKGFEIGVQRGDACINELAGMGLDTRHLVAYPDYTSMLSATESGDIKIFCMDVDPANYYLYLRHDQLRFSKAFTLYKGRFHWAVNRGDTATFALVSQGMARITPKERSALRAKWIHRPDRYPPYLRNFMFAVLAALGVLVIASTWIWILRRAVRNRTAEIRKKNRLLEKQSRELVDERAQLRTLVESSPDAMWLKNKRGIYVECNKRTCELTDLSRSEIIGHTDQDGIIPPTLRKRVQEIDELVLQTGTTQSGDFQYRDTTDTERTMELIKAPIHAPDGQVTGVLGVARDITERRRAEEEQRIAAIAFESQDGVVICDAEGVIQRVNKAFTTLTGFTPMEAIGSVFMDLVRSSLRDADSERKMQESIKRSEVWSGNRWISPRRGVLRNVRHSVSGVHDDQGLLKHIVHTLHDLTDETEARARAEHLENFDHLTELPNRRLLEERIRQANEIAASASRSNRFHGALLLIDLDNFSAPNNTHGHRIGDRILQQAAQRMQSQRPPGSLISRFSGDEFAVFMPFDHATRHDAAEDAVRSARTLRDALARPYEFPRIGEVICTASIGVTLLGIPIRSPDNLLGEAELAMYKAKQDGKNRAQLFEQRMLEEIESRDAMTRDLRKGLRSNQFLLYYQPQVDVNGRIVGSEALLRWKHPEHGLIAPSEFIGVAEFTGLIEPLGRLVLQQACLTLASWKALPDMNNLSLSINVSPRQFRQPDFVDQVAAIVTSSGVDAQRLKLEITESMAMDDIRDATTKFEALKALGVRISLDDFGTGSSSLAYLTLLPLDQIKIDKSFVRELPHAKSDAHLARSILGMAHGMDLEVVAEGVETREQFEFLRRHGCQLFQGYLFGRPLPMSEFQQLVERSSERGIAPS